MDNPSQIHLKSRLLPAIVLVTLALQLVDPSPIWRALLIAFGGAWLVSYLWIRSLARGLTLQREMRFGWAQVGDRLEERFTLQNHSLLPALWVEIIDQSTLPGYRVSRVTEIGGDSRNQWRTHGVCTQRGVFTLGPASLTSGDPLGFYLLEIFQPSTKPLMVLPPIVPLADIEIAPGGRVGEGRPRANSPERTISAASVREYAPGDSFRMIHWRTTAKHDDLFVRMLEGTPAGDWWIFLDLDRNFQCGSGWDSTEEHSVILAASLADQGLRAGQAVGFVVNGDPLVWLPPKEGEGQRWEILRSLAITRQGAFPVAELLERNRPAIRQRTSLALITPNIQGDWIEALIPLIWRGIVPTVLLLDPGSFDPERQAARQLQATLAQLASLGVARYVITREVLDRPEAHPGKQGQWEFRVSPRGRAIAVNPPVDGWKELS